MSLGPGLGGKQRLAADASSHAYFMADISSVTFTIRATDHSNVRGRAVRRIFLSDHALKLAKLFAGDVVVLTPASDIHQGQVGASAIENPVSKIYRISI